MKPDLTQIWEWQGKTHRYDVFASDDFSNLSNVRQVYGLVLSQDHSQILVVREGNGGGTSAGEWMLPGGKVEAGETWIETLAREVREETNRDIDAGSAKPLFYQNAYEKNEAGQWVFRRTEIRYTVEVAIERDFVSDSGGMIVEAIWVPIANLGDYLDWGETTRMIKDLLSWRDEGRTSRKT